MEKVHDTTKQEEQELWRKSIPAQVFLNHFFGIHRHIAHQQAQHSIADLGTFKSFAPELSQEQKEQAKKMLIQCWNTEYALRTTAANGDESYLKNALHWTFPQAYYCLLFGAKAFLAAQGATVMSENAVRLRLARLVTSGWYPLPVSFAAFGSPGHYSYRALPEGYRTPNLELVDSPKESQAQVGQFLRTTRTLQVRALRRRLQDNPATAQINKQTGQPLAKFSRKHWDVVARALGATTFFDLFSRLKISANHREIGRFVEAEIDVRLFHRSLLETVVYLNTIHEAYVAKALGKNAYQFFLDQLPGYLRKGFVQKRFEEEIRPLLTEVRSIDSSLQWAS
ncbi:hypothetical protein GCM10027275_22700 [Rhabdobacter roseus]|uniref:Uncharacterized protein n=1 Tax=Rhabdobacter roseus TaxID=1655419 RepID=A0A840TR60_9BACT|nr:hypothetical protein [Rhabdobacter roseus]MBB5284207.1 hypothetical protein [Rhabdobacter roseus]